MDKDTLKKIAELTEAKFYEAQNKDKLMIFMMIDQLEKTDVKLSVNTLYDELYQWPLGLSILLLLLEFLLAKQFAKNTMSLFSDQSFIYAGMLLIPVLCLIFYLSEKEN